jgi:hypothetical protein
MQDGALGNGGAFVSAPFGRPPGQRTAGQTLKALGSASKPSATARRATYFELSSPFLSHASPRHPAGRPASLFMTVRHGTRYAAMSYVGPPRLRMVRLRGRRPSVTRHGAADAYSADAPEPPPRSWSQRVVEARCQDALGPADLRGRWGVAARLFDVRGAGCSVADSCRCWYLCGGGLSDSTWWVRLAAAWPLP